MNKILLSIALGVASSAAVVAQGLFSFTSAAGDRPTINGLDGEPVGGANYLVEVLVLDAGSGEFAGGLLRNTATGQVDFQPISPLAGATSIGLFSGGTIEVPFVAPGAEATLLVRAWDVTTGADYASAVIKGETSFNMELGGPAPTPPNPILPHYQGIQLVPEPSTYALAALGLGGLLFFRRKK
jgi:hypothetical protein